MLPFHTDVPVYNDHLESIERFIREFITSMNFVMQQVVYDTVKEIMAFHSKGARKKGWLQNNIPEVNAEEKTKDI